jgi:signal peptidase II
METTLTETKETPPTILPEPTMRGKVGLYAGIVGGIVALDVVTKAIVQRTLQLYDPVPVLGDFFRLTYIFNRGAAFGLSLGEHSRWLFTGLTILAIIGLFMWYRATPRSDGTRLFALASVTAGAIGNLIDRIRSEQGVVDFFDFGFGDLRWPVFNIADIAVTCGAVLLAISLWREDVQAAREKDGG